MPIEMRERIESLARLTKTSMADVTRQLLAQALENVDITEGDE